MKKIDAMGLSCPIPVVMAKKALKEQDCSAITISVDNKTSAENLEKLAKSLKCEYEVKQVSDSQYDIVIVKDGAENMLEVLEETDDEIGLTSDGTIIVITGEKMGDGDDELGINLMKAFVYALTEAETAPSKIILYNGGVKLNVKGAPTADNFTELEKKGAKIFSCGACLNYYGLTEAVTSGEVTNMYSIMEMMNEATKIIKP